MLEGKIEDAGDAGAFSVDNELQTGVCILTEMCSYIICYRGAHRAFLVIRLLARFLCSRGSILRPNTSSSGNGDGPGRHLIGQIV